MLLDLARAECLSCMFPVCNSDHIMRVTCALLPLQCKGDILKQNCHWHKATVLSNAKQSLHCSIAVVLSVLLSLLLGTVSFVAPPEHSNLIRSSVKATHQKPEYTLKRTGTLTRRCMLLTLSL